MEPPAGYWQTPPGVAPQVKKEGALWVLDEIFRQSKDAERNRVIYPGNTITPYPLPAEPIQPSQRPPQPKQAVVPATVQAVPVKEIPGPGTVPNSTQNVIDDIGQRLSNATGINSLGIAAGPVNLAANLALGFVEKFPIKSIVVTGAATYLGVGITKAKIPSFTQRLIFGLPAGLVFGELVTPTPAFSINDEGPYFTTFEAEQARAELASFVLTQVLGLNVPEPGNQPPTPPMWQADP